MFFNNNCAQPLQFSCPLKKNLHYWQKTTFIKCCYYKHKETVSNIIKITHTGDTEFLDFAVIAPIQSQSKKFKQKSRRKKVTCHVSHFNTHFNTVV